MDSKTSIELKQRSRHISSYNILEHKKVDLFKQEQRQIHCSIIHAQFIPLPKAKIRHPNIHANVNNKFYNKILLVQLGLFTNKLIIL